MDGAVALPTRMLHLDDWTEVLTGSNFMKPLGRIIDYQHQHTFVCHYLILFFPKQIMHIPTWIE